MNKISVFWFRRDLRLHDNVGLFHALNSGKRILPIFIFDSTILKKLQKNDARITFIHKELNKLNQYLKPLNSGIHFYHGTPKKIFQSLVEKYQIVDVYTNHDYEPYAIQRDLEIEELLSLNNIQFHTYKDQVIFERNEITKQDGNPYVVYTPYSKKWLEAYRQKRKKITLQKIY